MVSGLLKWDDSIRRAKLNEGGQSKHIVAPFEVRLQEVRVFVSGCGKIGLRSAWVGRHLLYAPKSIWGPILTYGGSLG